MKMIEAIGYFFKHIIGKYSKLNILFGVIIILILYTFIIHPINLNDIISKVYDTKQQEEVDKHHKELEERDHFNEVMPVWMENLMYKFNADAVLLLELHNSGNNLSGLPFKKFTCTIELVNFSKYGGNKDYSSPYLESQPIGSYYKTFKMLEERSPLILRQVSPEQIKSPTEYMMSRFDIKTLYLYPLKNDENKIDMILLVAFTDGGSIPEDDVNIIFPQFLDNNKKDKK
jgi:hypothetical protein